jgi:hypothetical protein
MGTFVLAFVPLHPRWLTRTVPRKKRKQDYSEQRGNHAGEQKPSQRISAPASSSNRDNYREDQPTNK